VDGAKVELFAMTPHRWMALGVLAAVGLLRISELVFSKLRIRADGRAQAATVLPERAYPWMVAVHAGWFAGCAVETWGYPADWPLGVCALAAGGWTLSLALRGWLMASLGRWWNVRLIARADQPVITRGPYAWIRHPNYLAVILEIAAVPLLLEAPWTAVLASAANAVVLYFRIRGEEQYLIAQPGYREAFGHKKRLVPGVF
jgi:methyltransferase